MDKLKLEQEVRAMEDMCNIALRIFEDRNAEYGCAYEQTGVVGATAELIGDISRLRQLVFDAPPDVFKKPRHIKKLQDCFRDIHNYSGIAAMMLSRHNWSGERYKEPETEFLEGTPARGLLSSSYEPPDETQNPF